MANTLTNLQDIAWMAIDTVSREIVEGMGAVTLDPSAAQVAVGEQVRFPISRNYGAEDVTPGQLPPNDGDQAVDWDYLTITKSRAVPFRWEGEEQKGLDPTVAQQIRVDQIAQAIRTLVNEVEVDVAAQYKYASNAIGTAGTTPFGIAGNFDDFAAAHEALDLNGAPKFNRRMLLGSAEIRKLRGTQSILFKANEAGTSEMLRNGTVGRIEGFEIFQSFGRASHAKGTGTGYLANNASGFVANDTTLGIDTGSGTVLAGDIITFAGDSTKYVVNTGAAAAGNIAIARPGIKDAVANNTAMTIGDSYKANMVFDKGAIHLMTRQPYLPDGSGGVEDVFTVTDPVTGVTFQFAVIREYRRLRYEVALAWGVKTVKPDNLIVLLG